MATAFTHAFVAAGLAAVCPDRSLRLRLGVLLALLAVLPDADVLAFRLGIPYEHPLGHRGFTHSLFFAVLAGVLVGLVSFRRLGLGSRAWWRVTSLLVLATASHGILDAFTDAGLGIGFLIPFESSRYFAPWRPLETSPLSVQAFFSGPAFRIMKNEVLWVWVPVTVAVLLASAARRGMRAS